MLFGILSGCVTKPSVDPLLPQISVTEASDTDIRAYGRNFNVNPYMEPKTTLRGKLNEFFIAKIQFNLETEARISIIGMALSSDGQEVARFYDAQGFKAYWDAITTREEDNDALIQRKLTSIDRSCIPATEFKQKAGQGFLYVPFVGKNPIPRPAIITIEVVSSIGNTVVYSYTLKN